MSDLRKAAEMALEALEGALSDDQPYIEKSKKAAEALRQALAQPVDAVNMTQERVDETAKREHEPVAYTGNGTAGREADVRPTGFFFQMPKPIGEVYGWQGTGKGQPMCRFNASEEDMPVGTKLYTAPPNLEVAVLAERKRIVNLFMIQHEAAKGAHNYWQVAANLVQADQDRASGD